MDSIILSYLTACWLGILTSISPCPLATNITAISFIGKRLSTPKMVFLSGLFYVLGRMLTYIALGALLIASTLSIPELANLLQNNINKFLGPVLIITALFLLKIIPLKLSGFGLSQKMQNRVANLGIWGSGLLGIIFALSFCPTSAAIFFGSLIPLSLKYNSSVVLPSLYGIGTGLPVIIFAFLVALGTRYVGILFNKLTIIEVWARRITGIIFLLVGIYYSLIYIFKIPI